MCRGDDEMHVIAGCKQVVRSISVSGDDKQHKAKVNSVKSDERDAPNSCTEA